MASVVEHHYQGLSPAGFHRVRYLKWGMNDGRPTVLCVHGLTRNAHDFDRLAERLAQRYRVIAVDVVGRGGSDWLKDPVERNMRKVHAPFGPLTDAEWAHLVRYGYRRLPDGSYGLAYDPAIAENVKKGVADVDLWAVWDRIAIPTLVFRGAESDLLSAATARAMTERGPRARVVEFAGIGHAPALMADDQISAIESWLAEQT
jgi:pimeloyl-ACP methyl ester carboxylesterase